MTELVNLPNSKVLRLLSTLTLFCTFLIPQTSAHAASIGSSTCATDVQNAATASMTSSGGFCYLVFKSGTNSWTVPSGVTSSSIVLIAGGGAGGSGAFGGGGGAGGVVYDSTYALTSGNTYSLSVGAGGSAGTATLSIPTNSSNSGSNSWFFSDSTLVAIGGGAGASYAYGQSAGALCRGRGGGSGGGSTECAEGTTNSGGSSTQTIPAGADSSYGFAGGSTPSAAYYAGGGGGGAGEAGTNVTAAGSPGKGGNGTNAFSSWLTIINSSMSDYSGWSTATSSGFIAAGGGGASQGTPGAAGSGGGGTGGTNASSSAINGVAGIPGTGSGGGGATYNGNSGTGGAGGSGLIIIKFQAPDLTAPTITGPASATGATSSTSIPETATSVFTFTANESVTWTKSGTDSTFFSISSGGVLTITERDFESPADSDSNNSYIVVVTATDSASNATSQTVTVSITNVNEAPIITVASSSSNAYVSRAENTTAIFTYTGSDSDTASNLTWSISGTDVSFFAIDSSTGALRFIVARDFEAPADAGSNNTYIVTLTLSDGALSDSQTLTVTVVNANESATINPPTTSGVLTKGIVTTISVTSNAAGKVRFFVGDKRISGCLSRATSGSYPTFTATCSWKPAVTGRQSLTASVTPGDATFSSTTSSPALVQVIKRATTR